MFIFIKKLNSIKTDVEETIKRITAHKGVIGLIVVNSEGKLDQQDNTFILNNKVNYIFKLKVFQ